VAERRLRLSADNFAHYEGSGALWAAVAAIAAGVLARRRLRGWFAGRRYAGAGFVGALCGTIAAVLVNDSGGVMQMIGAVPLFLAAAVAWATRLGADAPPSVT
jgi:hypothetical protein